MLNLSPDYIACDTREPGGKDETVDLEKARIAGEILAMGQRVEIEKLGCGDYGSVSNDGQSWIIERKEAGDYLSSLTDGRLYSQFSRILSAPVDIRVLLPEGQVVPSADGKSVRTSRGKSEWDFKAIYHSWIELACLGVIILPFVPRQYAARAIVQFHETLNNGAKFVVEKHPMPIKLKGPLNRPRRYLEPMIGRSNMDKLSPLYPNLWTLFTAAMATPEEIQRVHGIGPQTVKNIRDLLVTRY